MVVPFNLASRSSGDQLALKLGHRVKAKSTTLGASRFRLIQVLRHLGLFEEKIAARLDGERELARALEMERLVRLQERREAARQYEESRAARWEQEEQFARLAERRTAARLLKEEMAYNSMSEEEQAAWRLEEEIVSWLVFGESGGRE